MSTHTCALRLDGNSDQYVPVVDGADFSPTSFDEDRAFEIAREEARKRERLDAAAPAMLEALKIALRYLPSDNSPGTERALVESAIAKAEGRG